MRKSLGRAAGFAIACAITALAAPAVRAEGVSPRATETAELSLVPLLERLARHGEQFEQMKRRGSYTLEGRYDELDADGHVEGRKTTTLHVTATPQGPVTEIVAYTEDGKDKTSEAREKARKARAEPKKSGGGGPKDLRLPFLASEQPRYLFSIAERDPVQLGRVRVAFAPRVASEDALKGSAWVDANAGEVLTMGFSLSKNPRFVDHVDVTIRFANITPIGRAPSTFDIDIRGSFLFIHRHYRGSGTISDTRIAF
jgi:hypothetical protein